MPKGLGEASCMEMIAYLLSKAKRCRRLAAEFSNQNDPAAKNLIGLAVEFEARAQRHDNAQRTIPEIDGSD
jgi:hypothetical protein